MSPRRRKAERDGWPDNLYERGGYYTWRNPDTGKELGIGRVTKLKAFQEAMKANAFISKQAPTLLERLAGGGETLAAMIERFERQLAKRKLAENTKRVNKSRIKRTREMFGDDTAIKSITTQVVADALDKMAEDEGKARLAQSMRSFWTEFFRFCIAKGAIERNPVDVTERVSVEVKRTRLSFEAFMTLYGKTQVTWLRNAMALALVSGQARENVAAAQFNQFRDGYWWNTRGKTDAKICIPLSIRLECFGMSLEDVVKQCRSTGVLSKYLIHQTERRGNSPVGQHIWLDTVSRRFTNELAALQLDWSGKAPPTFHEIRSLAARLYKAQGNVNTQQLLGHSDAEMTETYEDSRGTEWIKVSVG